MINILFLYLALYVTSNFGMTWQYIHYIASCICEIKSLVPRRESNSSCYTGLNYYYFYKRQIINITHTWSMPKMKLLFLGSLYSWMVATSSFSSNLWAFSNLLNFYCWVFLVYVLPVLGLCPPFSAFLYSPYYKVLIWIAFFPAKTCTFKKEM